MSVTFLKRITIPEYNAIDAVNYSTLKHILKSPRHFRHVRTAGTAQTEAMSLGLACHSATLEPDKFESDYSVWNQRTKSGRTSPRNGKSWDHFLRCNIGKTVITEKQYEIATVMRDSVRSDPTSMQFLVAGEAEVAMVWVDPITGLLCKGRVDWLARIDLEPVIVGLKTAVESGLDAFSRQSNRLLYHLQWAMYREGFVALTGEIPRVVEIAVESKPPHDPVVYEIGPDVIEPGIVLFRQAMGEVAKCRRTNTWPGQGRGEIVSLTLPSWAAGVPSDEDVSLDMTGIDMSALEGLEA